MDALFHSREEIECALVRLHCVPTDNREALLALGFQPMYPQVTKGDESRLWVRSIDSGYGSSLSNGRKFRSSYNAPISKSGSFDGDLG